MGPLTGCGSRFSALLSLLVVTISATYAQTLPVSGQCAVTSVPSQVSAEGLTERMGDIILQCSGSNPGAVLTGNLTVFLPANITNRLNSANQAPDAILSADVGGGFTPLPVTAQVSNQTITFSSLNVPVPASGSFSLRVSNLRAAVFQLGPTNTQAIRAQLAMSGSALSINQSFVVVAFAQPGLLATLFNRGQITCVGSPLPSTISLDNLFAAGTNFSSARITEGYAAAFHARAAGDDSGSRILIQYSGFPANAHVFVPDLVAGSSAAVPTSGGDLGLPQNGGQYVPGSGTLLLGRVAFADATGAGGFVPPVPGGPGPVTLNSASEVTLTGGSGFVVYEVLDANAATRESAQIPTFIGLASVTAASVANATVSLAPVSNIVTASATAPIPRFASVPPASDCAALGDCTAGYFPKLSVTVFPNPIPLTAVAGGSLTSQPGYIPVQNAAGGLMAWTASVQYVSGPAGWVKLDNTAGVNAGSVRVFVDAKSLAAGTYQAKVTIDAGSLAGSITIPVVLTVTPAPAPPPGTGTPPPPSTSSVQVSRVVNAATFDNTPLVAGSLGTVMGSNLSGQNVSVTFDGLAAKLLYTGASQINLQVPAGLSGKNSATMIVTVDGAASAPQTVILSPAWPSIFSGGVLNQDNSVNGSGSGAAAGTILQIYATGIPDSATVSAQIGGRKDLVPLYAGPAPTVTGVQQVNVAVPDGLDAGNSSLIVCATTASAQFCSAAYALVVQ
jgi:uncharacterized protein (TIGR03437 family)